MDITNFTKHYDGKTQYDYKMFVYGNYTYRDNLEADSLVEVLRNVIPYLNSRFKIHFTLMTPQLIKSLSFPNVHQEIYALPTYCNTMRTHFDAIKFLDMIDWRRNDFDIIYSHVPEHTAQIANAIYNNSNLRPKIIGYSHWFEVPQNAPYERTMFDSSMLGVLEMIECGVNSDWLKELVLKNAKKKFRDSVIKDLEHIIQPHYLGVDQYRPRSKNIIPKSVIFNHRPSGYTGWDWFVKQMDAIWEDRQDFTVYTTLAEVDRPWNKKVNLPTRSEYIGFLWRMQFGVGCFQNYSAWSISVTDGLSVSVPYLLPNDFCYPEMVPPDYPYLYKGEDEFRAQFEKMLDTPPAYNTAALAQATTWDNRIAKWFDGWDKVFELEGLKTETEGYNSVVKIIRESKYITKKDLLDKLGWGVRVKWSPYRNLMRQDKHIKFTKDGYEWVK